VAGAVAVVGAGAVYCAAAGLGAQLRDRDGIRPLRCSDADDLSMALVGTGFGYDPARRAAQAQLLVRMLPLIRDVRRMGSAALDLCMVAAGRLDAHYEHGLNVWDWAAGALIAAEAGAAVALPDPGQASGLVAAAAPGVAGQWLDALERFGGAASLA
jgi:myo-inositol-1(or 4)-monophosphatase